MMCRSPLDHSVLYAHMCPTGLGGRTFKQEKLSLGGGLAHPKPCVQDAINPSTVNSTAILAGVSRHPAHMEADPPKGHSSHRDRALSRGNSSTYQDIFELDITVHKSLAVQEADPFHHIECYLQTRLQRQPSLGGTKKLTRH